MSIDIWRSWKQVTPWKYLLMSLFALLVLPSDQYKLAQLCRTNWIYNNIIFKAVIFVLDASSRERITESRLELAKLLTEKELKDAALLILANKQVCVVFYQKHIFSSLIMSVLDCENHYQEKSGFIKIFGSIVLNLDCV